MVRHRARPRVPGAWRRLLPWGLVAVAGVVTDAWVGRVAGPGSVEHDATTLELAAAMAGVHARYLASLVWPARLSVDYPVDPAGSWASPWPIGSVVPASNVSEAMTSIASPFSACIMISPPFFRVCSIARKIAPSSLKKTPG